MATSNERICFLCGIGGSGMSALAQLLITQGWQVTGSDRSYDRGETPEKFERLKATGVTLYPQDGSGIRGALSLLVVSSAVEDSIPDVQAAKDKNIPIRKRADVLAEYFNAADLSIATGGTSGKSTVTAMIGWILSCRGFDPTIVNGAEMINFSGNFRGGSKNLFIAEVDESDGSIAFFRPSVSILTNISLDHKPMEELRRLFADYVRAARKRAVINFDDPEAKDLRAQAQSVAGFALEDNEAGIRAYDIKPLVDGVSFAVGGGGDSGRVPVRLKVFGRHNVANALAAIAGVRECGVSLEDAAEALAFFEGTKRRFEVVGTVNGITVIDDFAHNPDKIAVTLQTLKESPGRIWAVFQPHGLRPTKLMQVPLTAAWVAGLRADDVLLMPEIYYAGGTAEKVISSLDIINNVKKHSKNAHFFEKREKIIPFLKDNARSGDRIVVMGARDDTLPGFGRDILTGLAR